MEWEAEITMFPGENICLECREVFGNDIRCIPVIFRTQAIMHACLTGHSNFQLIGTDIKIKIKANKDEFLFKDKIIN